MAWEKLLLSQKKKHPTTQKKAAPWKLQMFNWHHNTSVTCQPGLVPKVSLKLQRSPAFGSSASCPPAKSWTSDTFQLSNHHPSLKSEPAAALVKFHRSRDAVHRKMRYNWGWFARLSLMVFVLLQKLIEKFVHHHYHIGSDPKMYKTVAYCGLTLKLNELQTK